MKFTKKEYNRYVADLAPKSPLAKDLVCSFCIGGLICALGQLILNGWKLAGLDADSAGTATSVSLIFISAVLTGLSIYDDIAKVAGAGTIVPITGFANSIVAPAVEFRTEGVILGTCAKMFTIAGPVLVFGTLASVVYGLIYWLVGVLL